MIYVKFGLSFEWPMKIIMTLRPFYMKEHLMLEYQQNPYRSEEPLRNILPPSLTYIKKEM